MVSDTLSLTTRAAHDVGLAAWLGGAMFGKFAHNPALRRISSRPERGAVANAAWNGYNIVNALGRRRLGRGARDGGPSRQALGTRADPVLGQGRLDGRIGRERDP
jgi:hypothetical protein